MFYLIFLEISKDKWVDLEFHPLLIIYSIHCVKSGLRSVYTTHALLQYSSWPLWAVMHWYNANNNSNINVRPCSLGIDLHPWMCQANNHGWRSIPRLHPPCKITLLYYYSEYHIIVTARIMICKRPFKVCLCRNKPYNNTNGNAIKMEMDLTIFISPYQFQ